MLQRVAISLVMLATVMLALQLLPAAADGTDEGLACPAIDVTGSQSGPADAMFTVNIAGGHVDPSYNWAVSAGSIGSGQGSATIAVNGLSAGEFLTATVEIGGLPANCNGTDSETVIIEAQQ